MATVVLQAVGAGVGTMLGGPLGGMIGRAIGAVAGSFIDQKLFGGSERREGARLSDLRVMASSEGAPVPRIWGGMRVAGQVIWATDFEEKRRTDTMGGKGGGGGQTIKTYSYFANFAVALCEGEIDRIGRVWADGKPFEMEGVAARVYTGSETQAPDGLIVAKLGASNAPAYRGTAYVVFERLPLADFGNRLPQLTFEVFRGAGGAAAHVRAVSIIPGSTEFGYDTKVVRRQAGAGVTQSENAHASAKRSDFRVSLDALTATCRNAGAAALVVAWFGTDLRCGLCAVRPGAESPVKLTKPGTWMVNGVARDAAHIVSAVNGGPAYGGTPSDASVIRAIQELRDRGLKVLLHPFVLMDIPPGNGLPDPYGGPEQAAYPWRGRITAKVAAGRPGSPDKTAAMAAEISAFVGRALPRHFTGSAMSVAYSGPAEWSFRRMILHYATLCALAGGVDAFLIGSELRGLTTLRREGNQFPFVEALRTLAAEVKAILPGAQVSYGADWTEYNGHQPADGTGDVFFHLDPFWASPHVGFTGINNYMPLADWRDGSRHADYLAGADSVHDISYLTANIAGGEGFDWYYASPEDRAAQRRTPIADGAYGKPWVFRPKDLKGWWSNLHYDRPGGIERPAPTAFVPQAKPIWFTEAGCAAIDKGANEPNAFLDPKSSESRPPVFSKGSRDDLMQNRFITALGQYWSASGGHNPVSAIYGNTMVDPGRIFLWAWDARPYPQFPALAGIWSDAPNYARGHWLNGRLGALQLGYLIAEVAASYGCREIETSGVDGLVHGFMIDRVMSGREALRGLMTAFAIDAADSGTALRFFMRRNAIETRAGADDLAQLSGGGPLYAIRRAQETELPASIKLSYMEAGLDYRLAVVEARHEGGSSRRDGLLELPAAVEQQQAQASAAIALHEAWAGREAVEFALPPSFLALEPGDAVTLALDGGDYRLRIEEISDGAARKIRGRSFNRAVYEPGGTAARAPQAEAPALYGAPDALLLDLPLAEGAGEAYLPWIAAMALPWPGSLALYRQTGPAAAAFNREIELPATMGELASPLAGGLPGRFDRGASFTVRMGSGELLSVTEEEVLQGANLAAVGSMAAGWEIIQFARAELTGEQTYRVSLLLRGQAGSEAEIRNLRLPGERFVLLDQAVVQPALSLSQVGLEHSWRVLAADTEFGEAETQITHRPAMLGLRPLAPVHLRARRQGGDLVLSWTRRTRLGGDSWELEEVPLGEERERYRLEVLAGSAIKRSLTLAEPEYLYAAADMAADLAGARQFTLRVAQLSSSFGAGPFLERIIDV